jgi:SPP1 family predicted phage head-tail adaptor
MSRVFNMIGTMSERVTFQEPNQMPNGQGGFKLDKANPIIIGEFWAAVVVNSFQEALKYGGRRLEANIEITARSNNRLTTKCQAIWQGQTLDIIEILPGKKPGYIRIFAKEAV